MGVAPRSLTYLEEGGSQQQWLHVQLTHAQTSKQQQQQGSSSTASMRWWWRVWQREDCKTATIDAPGALGKCNA